MSALEDKRAKQEMLKLSISSEIRGQLDRAARLIGKTRAQFVLDAARQAAMNVIMDHANLTFIAPAYAEFVARPDDPPSPNKRLWLSLHITAPWE
jgi:uncharacterized protein (DUF1778 family)